jgi:release factor glutamine methyltransferase
VLRAVQKRIIHYTWRPILLRYLRHDRPYSFDGLKLIVRKGVFHPGFFFSSRLLIEALQRFDLKDKNLLELGCGSGMISCWSAREGAKVSAVDLNRAAVANAKENAEANGLAAKVKALQSDLFDALKGQWFDFIVVNPPYYPKHPKTDAEQAWYCGEGFEYFHRFFKELSAHISSTSVVLMSLSEDCDLESIQQIGKTHDFGFKTLVEKRTGWENHFIFQLQKINKV